MLGDGIHGIEDLRGNRGQEFRGLDLERGRAKRREGFELFLEIPLTLRYVLCKRVCSKLGGEVLMKLRHVCYGLSGDLGGILSADAGYFRLHYTI